MEIKFYDEDNSFYVVNSKGKLTAGPFNSNEEARIWLSKFITCN